MSNRSHISLTGYRPLRSAIVIVVVLFALAPFALCKKVHYSDTFHPPMNAPNIVLESASGKYDMFAQNKKLYLLFFGYTNCPDICPMTLSRMAQTLKLLNEKYADKIEFIFISVDVAFDTPEKAAKYATGFHPAIRGLSGTQAEVDAVTKSYAIFVKTHQTKDKPSIIDHTGAIFWINDKHQIPKRIPSQFDPVLLAQDIELELRAL